MQQALILHRTHAKDDAFIILVLLAEADVYLHQIDIFSEKHLFQLFIHRLFEHKLLGDFSHFLSCTALSKEMAHLLLLIAKLHPLCHKGIVACELTLLCKTLLPKFFAQLIGLARIHLQTDIQILLFFLARNGHIITFQPVCIDWRLLSLF